jgi:two-component system, NtrC family, sensor kinase
MSGDPGDSEEPAFSQRNSAEPRPSGRRPLFEGNHTEGWLDELLILAERLPIDRGVRPVVAECVEQAARLLPECAVGACVADAGGEPIVELRIPDHRNSSPGHDPTRLFPSFAYEKVFELGGDLVGATLHIASDNANIELASSLEATLAERAARVLRGGIRHAIVFQRARQSSRDVQRLQAKFIQAEKLASLGQIVAGVVHELNNPLTSIVAYSDFLRKKAKLDGADEGDIERLRRIGEAAQRILKFSRDLVAYARPSSDIPGPVMLHEVIEKALVFCEHEFSESGVQVSCNLSVMPPVRGIAGQLTQVFVNLFTNAAHAMNQHGGSLTIIAQPQPADDLVLVDVADEGSGIAPQDLEQIFEPFFTTKTDGRGTGLGLSIVREIVVSHGGTLTAKSSPGKGSVFTVALPLAAVPASLTPPPSSGPSR